MRTFAFFLAFICSIQVAFARDFYEVLGVARTAPLDDIKKAYRVLAMRYHPDHNHDSEREMAAAVEKFREVQEAYETLSDTEKRERYDRMGAAASDEVFRASEERRRERDADRIRKADLAGQKHSNDKWTYSFETHSFFDKRTGKTLTPHPYFMGQFISEEGWTFESANGKYVSGVLSAVWNPEGSGEDRFWRRYQGGRIDPATGFPPDIAYNPRTTSDSSALFDSILNPVLFESARLGTGNRRELLRQFTNLTWTEARKADFIERAKTLIQIYKHPSMNGEFDMATYKLVFMETVLGNPKSRDFYEIIVEFISDLPTRDYADLAKLLEKKEFTEHPNALKWTRKMLTVSRAAQDLVYTIFRGEDVMASIQRFEQIFPLVAETGLLPRAMSALIENLVEVGGEAAFEAFKEGLIYLAQTRDFKNTIAAHDPKNTIRMQQFLNWYAKYDAKGSEVYLRALAMPGAHHGDFYVGGRTDPVRGWIPGHVDREAFNQAKLNTARERTKFLQANPPAMNPRFPLKYTRAETVRAIGGPVSCRSLIN